MSLYTEQNDCLLLRHRFWLQRKNRTTIIYHDCGFGQSPVPPSGGRGNPLRLKARNDATHLTGYLRLVGAFSVLDGA